MAKVYDLNSDKELDGIFGTEDHDNNINNHNKEHIPRAKGRPIENNKKNKPSSTTIKETSPKAAHTKETNKEDKGDKMDTIYNKEEEKDEGMTLDSGPSTPDPPNPDKLIGSDDEMETKETILEDYDEAKVDHNHPNLHMIW